MKHGTTSALAFLAALLLVLVIGTPVWAQAPGSPAPAPAAPPGAAPSAGATGAGGTVAVIAVIVALLVIVAIGVKLFDLKRKRTAEAVHLQAQVSDALLRDENLVGVAVTPTAHVPFWSGGPATVELSGRPESVQRREAALRIAEREARRLRPDVNIVDRMAA